MIAWDILALAGATLACFGVIFALGIKSILEYRAAEPLRETDRDPCPWPIDDEAEADGLLAEFHPFHSTHLAPEGQRDHA